MVDYVNFGQQLQSGVLTNTIFWVITIALAILVIAISIVGFKKILNTGRLKWFILHSISIFLVGYFFRNLIPNQYLFILILAILVTLLATFYRYVMFKTIDTWKNRGFWFLINLFSFLVIQIIYNVIKLTEPFLQIVFASFCITLVGAIVHRDFKPIPKTKNHFRPHHRIHKHRRK